MSGREPAELARRLRVMVVTGPLAGEGRSLPDVVDACLVSGATAVELRDEEAPDRELLATARLLGRLCRRRGALFVVNDRADVALAAGADGVHLGPADPPVAPLRARVPPGFVIGYSTDEPAEARRAAGRGADYLGVGAVYGTRSKAEAAGEAIGPGRVGRVLRAAELPGVGIGGITPERAGEVAARGAGVAVLGAVMDAPDPGPVVAALRSAVDAHEPYPAGGPDLPA